MVFNRRKNYEESTDVYSELQSEEVKQIAKTLEKFARPIINHRESILKQVEKCILNDRQNTYGTPEDNFQTIANYWNEYLKLDSTLTKQDVAIMMILLKIARMGSSPNHLDNFVDAAGYSIIAGSFCNSEKENEDDSK